KSGGREPHGQAQMFFQSGALQNVNVTARERTFGITESDERWKHFINGGFQLGGPVTRRWTYFTATSGRDLKKWVRNQSLPVSGGVGQQSFNLAGALSPIDRVTFYTSVQEQKDAQAGASSQITRQSSIHQYQDYHLNQA